MKPLGAYLGVDRVIATRARIDEDGAYTGELEFYAYGPHKETAIVEFAEANGIDLADSYAYSDSITDVPMLAAVGHPVAVNPDKDLEREAVERGWEVRHFARPVRLRDRVPVPSKGPTIAVGTVVAAGGAAIGGVRVVATAREPRAAVTVTAISELATLPTPIQRMDALAAVLDTDATLLVKRDDLTGLALGGNKAAQARPPRPRGRRRWCGLPGHGRRCAEQPRPDHRGGGPPARHGLPPRAGRPDAHRPRGQPAPRRAARRTPALLRRRRLLRDRGRHHRARRAAALGRPAAVRDPGRWGVGCRSRRVRPRRRRAPRAARPRPGLDRRRRRFGWHPCRVARRARRGFADAGHRRGRRHPTGPRRGGAPDGGRLRRSIWGGVHRTAP